MEYKTDRYVAPGIQAGESATGEGWVNCEVCGMFETYSSLEAAERLAGRHYNYVHAGFGCAFGGQQ